MAWLGFPWTDIVAMGVLFLATIGYHVGYRIYARQRPLRTVKGKIHLYRRTWVKRAVETGQHLVSVQATRNLVMVSSFMASSALLAIAVILNFMVSFQPGELGLFDPDHVRFKLLVLLSFLGFSFMAFLQALRDLSHFTVLMGADHDLIGHVEPVDAVTYLTNIINRAADRYTYGQRGFLFTLPVIAWLFSTMAFLVLTVVILVYVAGFLDFKKWRPPAMFRKEVDEAV